MRFPAAFACSLAAFGASMAVAAPPAVTVYNQNFGVVREQVTLDLKAGVNELRYSEISAHVEPDSVILRDPTGRRRLQILEQNYRNDPVSQELLLSLNEGQTIDFIVYDQDAPNRERIVRGKIIRSAYVPHRQAWDQYGQGYYAAQGANMGGGAGQPIVEVDGQIRFGLPGTPRFPSLGDDTILKPMLHWLLETDAGGPLTAELSYVTGGMHWRADYNLLAPPTGDELELIGWVTIDNQCGRTFENAQVKLMAGDVSKLRPEEGWRSAGLPYSLDEIGGMRAPTSQKTFDEYHLYTLHRPTTLRDRETKQVEFLRAAGIRSQRIYVYDGVWLDTERYRGWDPESIRIQSDYGTQCNPKVWVMREFTNSADNYLGTPLPAGRIRCYRGDDDGRLEFIGENQIEHTPKDELVRVYTGNAFDPVGERRRTNFRVQHDQYWADESFEIQLRNHKSEPVEIRVVEHLYRWHTWEIRDPSQDFVKKDAQTIEFPVQIPPDGEATVRYLVHYTW